MNYNPFEKPFASGEFTSSGSYYYFLLDNNLTAGVYLLDVYLFADDYHISLLIKIFEDEKYCFTSLAQVSGYTTKFYFDFSSLNSNRITLNRDNNELDVEGSTINVYKIA